MAKKHLLLVEDDPNLGFVTKDSLENEGYQITWEKGGEDALTSFCAQSYDLCIIDIMLPQKDGFELVKDIRTINQQVPIIFVSAKSMDEDKIKGLKLGSDDYVCKPFNIEELLLRIEKLLLRSTKPLIPDDLTEIYISSLTFHPTEQKITGPNNYTQHLTKKECAILKLLYQHQGTVLKREYALKLLWGESDYFKGRSMDVFITKIRKYLQVDPSIKIENIHGSGFKLSIHN